MNKHSAPSSDGAMSGAVLPSEALVSATDLWLFQLQWICGSWYWYRYKCYHKKNDDSFDVVGGVINMKSGGVTKLSRVLPIWGFLSFGFIRCNFDIKDFDTNLITGFANFEYDIDNTLVKKMKVNYIMVIIHLVPNQSKMMNLLSTVKLNVFQFLLNLSQMNCLS
jgi:hypothetical protein